MIVGPRGLTCPERGLAGAAGVPRIRPATDLGNVPVANSFARTGYTTFERAINFVRDTPGAAGP